MDEKALEAAVRAMHSADVEPRRFDKHWIVRPWDEQTPEARTHWTRLAQAAITAYLEASGEASVTTAALAVLKAVDFNFETKETPPKYTVPWIEIVALRKALIAAGIKTEGEYRPAIDTALEGK